MVVGSHNQRSPTGRWVVMVLLTAGLIAGAGAVWYWTGRSRAGDGPAAPPAARAGAAPFDEQAAAKALERIEEPLARALEQGRPGQVLPLAEELVTQYPRYAPARRMLGNVHLAMQAYDKALEQFDLALDLDPHQPGLRALAGTAAMEAGRFDDARRHLDAAINLSPRTIHYRLLLSQLHLRQGDLARARDVLLAALRVDSSSHAAHALLANAFARQGKLGLALEQVHKALDLLPDEQAHLRRPYVRQQAALLRRDNRPEESLQALLTLPGKDQFDLDVMDDLATSLAMMGQPGQAAVVYEQRVDLDPSDDIALARAARWRITAGDRAAARQHIAALQRINPALPVIAELEARLTQSDANPSAAALPAPATSAEPAPPAPAP